MVVLVEKIEYKIRMVEVNHDFSKDSGDLESLKSKSLVLIWIIPKNQKQMIERNWLLKIGKL